MTSIMRVVISIVCVAWYEPQIGGTTLGGEVSRLSGTRIMSKIALCLVGFWIICMSLYCMKNAKNLSCIPSEDAV